MSLYFRFYCKFLACWIFLAPSYSTAETIPGEFILKFSKAVKNSGKTAASARLGLTIKTRNKHSGSFFAKGKLDHLQAKELLATGALDYIEANSKITLSKVPSDSDFSKQWALAGQTNDIDMDTLDAWNISTGSPEIVVGIIDSGLNYNHPDLSSNLWSNPGEIPNNGRDDDGNGVVDDVHGYNSINGGGDPKDNNGHGSHCAGIIGASGNNSLGVSGINWNVSLMGLKFLDGAGIGTTQNAIAAIEYAVEMKQRGVNLRVLSNSWGGNIRSQALEDAVAASNNAGILFVAAAGNAGGDNDLRSVFPAGFPLDNVISVGAVDKQGNLANFSNYGAGSVDLAAPGVEIISTSLGSNYQTLSGTSMAAPHVAGVAALLLAVEPGLTPAQLKNRLKTTIKPLPGLEGLLKSPGMVNAGHALTNTKAPIPEDQKQIGYTQNNISISPSSDLGDQIISTDDTYAEVSLPFHFPFYDESFQRLAVSANGRITPLGLEAELPTESDYSNTLRPGILVWHDDLHPSASSQGGVWLKTHSDHVSIRWIARNFAHRHSNDSKTDLDIEAKLFSSGAIEFHFHDTDNASQRFGLGASSSTALVPFNSASGKRLIIAHNESLPEVVGSGKALGLSRSGGFQLNDFDGDSISDLVVWRPSSGHWFVLPSANNFDVKNHHIWQLGLPGDIPKTGDFDGDSLSDMAVWRPSSGTWFFRLSSQNYQSISSVQWGLFGDNPLTGDFDGDGQTDLTVYRPTNGTYYSLLSSSGYNPSATNGFYTAQLGNYDHDGLVGDITGDGKDEFIAVWRPAKIWSVKNTAGELLSSLAWGVPGDTATSCDWNGDKRADQVIVRGNPVTGLLDWYVATTSGAVYTKSFGLLQDQIACNADYDGDKLADTRVWRPADGNWFIDSSSGQQMMIQFGLPGDIAL